MWSILVTAALVAPALAGEVHFSGEGHAATPTWSADGKYLAFEVNTLSTDIDLFVSEVTGDVAKDAMKVTRAGGTSAFGGGGQVTVNPSWFRDGSTNVLLFEGSNQGGAFRIYYRTGTSQASEYIPTTEIPGHLTFPSAGSDGTLLFVSAQTGSGDVRTRDRQTGAFGQVTNTPVSEMFPLFSGDRGKVLFSRKENGAQDIYEIPVAGGTETAIAQGGGDQTRPVYAANGAVAFFDGSRGTNLWDLVVTSGGQKRTLARDVRLPERSRPALTPDGAWVAWTLADPTKGDRVMVGRVDGSKTVEVPTRFTACAEPALKSQGGRTLLAFTALPASGADWRFLYVLDVTEKVQ